MVTNLHDRFRGCLLGLAVGDALGARFEARSPQSIRRLYSSIHEVIDEQVEKPYSEIWYTDDTQMAIGIAETLADNGRIREQELCAAFANNYEPDRGYGRGARAVLHAMQHGLPHRAVAASYFPGGSYGNGAAMRVAPLGIFFRDDEARLFAEAELSAQPTHLHPLGIEGAQLVALATAIASRTEAFDRDAYFSTLLGACRSDVYRQKLEAAARIESPEQLAELGNGIEAMESAPTAIASFALAPENYAETIGNVIFLGGDTDTMAAMAGGISGAYLGAGGIPEVLLARLESTPKGGKYIAELADKLFERYQNRIGSSASP